MWQLYIWGNTISEYRLRMACDASVHLIKSMMLLGVSGWGLYEDKPGGEDAYAPMYVAFRSCLNNKICWYWHRIVLCSGDVLSIGLGANRCQDRVVRA
jgi:hypothetical protein